MGLPPEGIKDLAEEYDRSLPWIRKQILEYNTPIKVHNPRESKILPKMKYWFGNILIVN